VLALWLSLVISEGFKTGKPAIAADSHIQMWVVPGIYAKNRGD
jgi:hypothetical protein